MRKRPAHRMGVSADIVALGEALYELCAIEEGGLERAKTYQAGFGGDSSNFAVAAARSGGRVGYLTRVGADAFGDALLALWAREGIDHAHVVRDAHAQTGVYFIARTEAGHAFTHYRADSAASRMQPGFFPREYVANAKLLHISGISQAISESACATTLAAMELARRCQTLVSYDSNLRLNLWPLEQARDTIHHAVSLCDIFLPSYDDVTKLTGLEDAEEIIDFYLTLGVPTVVMKMGGKGALLAHEGRIESFPGFPLAQVDASGAGDCFCGAFAAKLIDGNSLQDSVHYACAAAALSVTGLGTVRSFPRQEAVRARFPQVADI